MLRLSVFALPGLLLILLPFSAARAAQICSPVDPLPPVSDGIWSEQSYLPRQEASYTGILDSRRDRLYAYETAYTATDRVLMMSLAQPGRWIPLASIPGPGTSGQQTHLFIDADCERLIFYKLRDIWVLPLDGPFEWTQLEVTGSLTTRTLARAIYDPVNDRILRFGGGDTNEIFRIDLSGDREWTRILPEGPEPAGRSWPGVVYDPTRRQMLVFGGRQGFSSYLDDLWAFPLDGEPVWRELKPSGATPDRRYFPSFVHDPAADRFIMFSGYGDNGLKGEVWSLDLKGSPEWVPLSPSGSGPPPRMNTMFAWDAARGRALLFSGSYFGARPAEKNVWALSLGERMDWTFVAGAPYRRNGEAMIFDSLRRQMVLFGGYHSQESDYLNDLWTYRIDDGIWTRHVPPGDGPSGRGYHSAAYDPIRDRMIVFGGEGPWHVDAGYRNDLWELSLGDQKWSELSVPGRLPGPRSDHVLIYDPAEDRLVLFGGSRSGLINCRSSNYGTTVYWGDVWTLPIEPEGRWSEDFWLTDGRYGSVVPVLDPRDGSILMVGGSVSRYYCEHSVTVRTEYFHDVRRLELAKPAFWSILSVKGVNMTPIRCGAAWDPIRGRVLTYAGFGAGPAAMQEMIAGAGSVEWRALSPGGTPPPGNSGRSTFYDPVGGDFWVFNADGNMSVWKLDLEANVPERGRIVDSRVDTETARLTWCLDPGLARPVRISRRLPGEDWVPRAELVAGEDGLVTFEDTGLKSGVRHEYRVEAWLGTCRLALGETAVTTTVPPAFVLARIAPNPAVAAFRLHMEIPRAGSVELELFDVQGRRVLHRDLGTLDPGKRDVEVEPGALSSGVYMVRLRHEGGTATGRLVLIR